MSYKNRILIIALLLFIVCDAAAWFATMRVANSIAPEQAEAQAAAAAAEAAREATVPQANDLFAQVFSLAGEWRYKQAGSASEEYYQTGYDDSAWRRMAVPSNWYLEGLNYHGVIWYRTEFTVDPSWQGRLLRLNFGGVDYFAEVWLNGEALGRHAGYFEPFSYNVTDLMLFGQPNVLTVRVDSPYEEVDTVWPGRKTLIKGVFSHSAVRPGSPWRGNGQEYNTGGIWGEVSLEASSYLTVEEVQIHSLWSQPVPERNAPQVTAAVLVKNYSDQPSDANIELVFTPRNFAGDEIRFPALKQSLQPGSNELAWSEEVENPVLWWPWDRGSPNLYDARVTVSAGGQVVAEKSITYGFREVRIDGDTWAWTVNGQRYFPRGTNYISSIWLSQSTPERLAEDVRLMREANLNFVRLPAHVEPATFYQFTDEAGLLVWQEFPLQWGYTDAPSFLDEAQRQMEAMVRQLGNHASIALWSAHNESPWSDAKIRSRAPQPDSRQNRQLDTLLKQTANQVDPTRFAHESSGSGDAHVYPGWDSGSWRDYYDLPGAPMVSEFGAQSLPGMEMLRQMFLPEELRYQSGETSTRWEFHNFQSNGMFDVAKVVYQRPEEGADPLPGLEALIQDSQAYQANLLRYAIESYRRARYEKVQGIAQFLFVDPWPSIGMSVLDNNRQAKAGYEALKTAMQPVLPSISPTLPDGLNGEYWTYSKIGRAGIGLWVVNDTMLAYDRAALTYTIVDSGGSKLEEKRTEVNVEPDSARIFQLIRGLDLPPGQYEVIVTLNDGQNKLLGRNAFKFEVLAAAEAAQP